MREQALVTQPGQLPSEREPVQNLPDVWRESVEIAADARGQRARRFDESGDGKIAGVVYRNSGPVAERDACVTWPHAPSVLTSTSEHAVEPAKNDQRENYYLAELGPRIRPAEQLEQAPDVVHELGPRCR